MRILLVEDEFNLAAHVQRGLVRMDHTVEHASDGPSAVAAALKGCFDLVVLDVNLPGCDGFEVLRRIRQATLPCRVLMLTARSEIGDRVDGLKAGADDYLTKPFAMEELLARVEALGRRGGKIEQEDVTAIGDVTVDFRRRRVLRAGADVPLSPREFDVFQIFASEPGRTFSRDEICERIWQREHEYDTRTVEIFIMRLRKKLDGGDGVGLIETVRGVGYRLRQP